MAVAVKNPEVTPSASLMTRVAAVSLVGVVYICASLAVVFRLVPELYWALGLNRESVIARFFLALVMLAALGALGYVGTILLGKRPLPGVKAGVFVGFVGILVILILTRWASLWFEHWAFSQHYFGKWVGAALTAAVFIGLLAAAGRFYFQPSFEKRLVGFEEQGWFSAHAYKPLQGVRVRRGTILGLLLIAGAGVYTLLSHGSLDPARNARVPEDWALNVPFTGTVSVVRPGDIGSETDEGKVIDPRFKDVSPEKPLTLDRYEVRDVNEAAVRNYARVTDPGATDLKIGRIYPVPEVNKQNDALPEFERNNKAKTAPVATAEGPTTFPHLTLLPFLQYTVPLLMIVGALWFAWRAVNMPAFADFLIATEAELNKVSWASRKRLIQDTVVVLITLVLMTTFLFGMDQVWRALLSWKYVGVLQIPETSQEEKPVENRPW